MPTSQLPLGVQLRESCDFAGFEPGANTEAVAAVRTLALRGQARVYLSGAGGTGKSHLLQAACRDAGGVGRRAAYLPLADLAGMGPGVLDGLGAMDLVCLDDVDAVAGDREWSVALVGALDGWRAAGCATLAAGSAAPAALTGALPDLASRLGWGAVYALRELGDGDKQALLARRAAARGLELPGDVAAYLLRRSARDVPALVRLLDRLDHASLASQRRLTIPFVKQVLEQDA